MFCNSEKHSQLLKPLFTVFTVGRSLAYSGVFTQGGKYRQSA